MFGQRDSPIGGIPRWTGVLPTNPAYPGLPSCPRSMRRALRRNQYVYRLARIGRDRHAEQVDVHSLIVPGHLADLQRTLRLPINRQFGRCLAST